MSKIMFPPLWLAKLRFTFSVLSDVEHPRLRIYSYLLDPTEFKQVLSGLVTSQMQTNVKLALHQVAYGPPGYLYAAAIVRHFVSYRFPSLMDMILFEAIEEEGREENMANMQYWKPQALELEQLCTDPRLEVLCE